MTDLKDIMAVHPKRQQVETRDAFTEEERDRIAEKSGHRCAHCGKLVYYGYGATVDHYVPVSRGGTNDMRNLIMLCESCNKEKGNDIINPEYYPKYLDGSAKGALDEYFDEYCQAYEYVDRSNILSCDRYIIRIGPMRPDSRFAKKRKGKRPPDTALYKMMTLSRARDDDWTGVDGYFKKYCRKYGIMDDGLAAEYIDYIRKFGTAYVIESSGEFKLLATMVFKRHPYDGATAMEDAHAKMRRDPIGIVTDELTIALFPYYANDMGYTLAYNMRLHLPMYILREQGLDQVPIRFTMAKADPLTQRTLGRNAPDHEGSCFTSEYSVCYMDGKEPSVPVMEDEKYLKFCRKFGDISEEEDAWLESHGYSGTAAR